MIATPITLVAGATGYVGGRLVAALVQRGCETRCLVRNPLKVDWRLRGAEIAVGDANDVSSLDRALAGVETAYYLIHSMGHGDAFAHRDRQAAENFAMAAQRQNVRRIIYLGGLGSDRENLSAHLRSRHEVGAILRAGAVRTIEFRASIILGAGSLSFELIRSLTDRLPVMICPLWLSTPTQPIAIDDVLAYLLAARSLPHGKSQVFEIGGCEQTTYGGLIREYARQRGLRRLMIRVPLLTPWLSSLWLALVTPAKAEIGRHLVEALRNPTVVNDRRALEVFAIRSMNVSQAMAQALADPENRDVHRQVIAAAAPLGREPLEVF